MEDSRAPAGGARRRLGRLALRTVLLLLGAALALQAINLLRLDAASFRNGTRALTERAARIRDGAHADYQVEVLGSLPSSDLQGAFHRLDDRLEDATIVPALIDRATPEGIAAPLLAWEFEDSERPDLRPVHEGSEWSVAEGKLRFRAKPDLLLTHRGPVGIPREEIADLVIRARSDRDVKLRLEWLPKAIAPKTLAGREGLRFRLDLDLRGGAEMRTYVINVENAMTRGLPPGSSIRQIFLMPTHATEPDAQATVEVDFIRFLSKTSRYARDAVGTAYQTLAGEMRQVLYIWPDRTVEYRLDLPEEAPRLDFGAGVIDDSGPVLFEVEIEDPTGVTVVHSRPVDSTGRWHDERVELSPWAGQRVTLRLRATGPAQNIAFWSAPIVSSTPRGRMNIVLLVEDTLRADRLSAHGYPRPTSPVKDRLLGRSGAIFLNAVSQATQTRPSVPSMMTSLLPSATGVWDFTDMLSEGHLTLAEVLRSQGFVTASFVQNGNAGPWAGLHQGFSTILGEDLLGRAPDEIIGDRLHDWLARHRDRNVFLYLHALDPHGPFSPPAPYDEWYREAPPEGAVLEPDPLLDPPWQERPTAAGRSLLYDGEIRRNDARLEVLLDSLEELGMADDTLLVMTSDHGEYLGEHGLWTHKPPGYLEVLGVPLMVVFPKRFTSPQRFDQPVQLLDIMPTILELAGVDATDLLLQGDSLVDLIEGRRLDFYDRRVTISEEPMAMRKSDPKPSGSLFLGDWQLLGSTRATLPGLPPLLEIRAYDTSARRSQQRPAWGFAGDLYFRLLFRRTMESVLASDLEAQRRWAGDESEDATQLDPDVLEQLRSLGYID